MNFEFATAQRIVFGPGKLREIASLSAGFGQRALVVTGRDSSRAATLCQLLGAAGIASEIFIVSGEPTIETAAQGVAAARECGADFVVGFGGGSAIDAGKAIAALCTNGGAILDYLEVIGRAQPLQNAPLPFIAVPTTAGTGAEATRNAVLHSPEHGVNVSLRSPLMLPRVALIDPELSFGLPPAITAATGLDALTQLIEPFLSRRANPMTDALCRDGTARVARSLRRAFAGEAAARSDMALASLFGGMALANAGLGAVHGFAAPLGGMFSAPHGAVCAALLPGVMEANFRALHQREAQNPALPRFGEIAQLLTGNRNATALEGIDWLKMLVRDLRIPTLSAYGITPRDFADIAAKAAAASSMQANPLVLTPDELQEILAAAL